MLRAAHKYIDLASKESWLFRVLYSGQAGGFFQLQVHGDDKGAVLVFVTDEGNQQHKLPKGMCKVLPNLLRQSRTHTWMDDTTEEDPYVLDGGRMSVELYLDDTEQKATFENDYPAQLGRLLRAMSRSCRLIEEHFSVAVWYVGGEV